MKKNISVSLKYKGIFLASPGLIKISNGFDYLNERLLDKSYQQELANNSKGMLLKFYDDINTNINMEFTDSMPKNILDDYDEHIIRTIIVKNNKLLIWDLKDLEDYQNDIELCSIDLISGNYIVHVFIKFDNKMTFVFEKVKSLEYLEYNHYFEFYLLYVDDKSRRFVNAMNFNNYMLKNYYLCSVADNTFNKKDNDFVYNLGKIKISSGKLCVSSINSFEDVSRIIQNEDYLDRDFPIGEFKVELAMRKSYYYGTFITGVKVIFSKQKTKWYQIAKTNTTKDDFIANHFDFGGIIDYEALNSYVAIRDYFSKSEEEDPFIKEVNIYEKKHKRILDKNNHFFLWDIPGTKYNVAFFNSRAVNNIGYSAYYGFSEDDVLTELFIPLVVSPIFKHKEFEIKGLDKKKKFIKDKINLIDSLLIDYFNTVNIDDMPKIINLPGEIAYEVEKILFEVVDLKVFKEFFIEFLKLTEKYPQIDFRKAGIGIMEYADSIYDIKEIITDSLNKPTHFKVGFLIRYLNINGYNSKNNIDLWKELKNLRKSSIIAVSCKAISGYKELLKKQEKKKLMIVSIIIFLTILVGVFISHEDELSNITDVGKYQTIISLKDSTSYGKNIKSPDGKYRIMYRSRINNYSSMEMDKEQVWYRKDSKYIHMELVDKTFKDYIADIKSAQETVCSLFTCHNVKEIANYQLSKLNCYYLTYSYDDNYEIPIKEYLIYQLDLDHLLVIYNDLYHISNEEFESIAQNAIIRIQQKK